MVLAAAVLILPQIVSAQASLGLETGAATGLGTRDLKDIISLIIRIFLGFLGLIAVVMIIYGGYIWMTAAGNLDNVDKGKKILINAIIGLVVILVSYAVVTFVINRFGAATQEIAEEGEPGDGDGDGFDDDQRFFLVRSLQPQGQQRIRNVIVQAVFNHNINPQSLNQNALVVEKRNEQGNYDRVAGIVALDQNNPRRVYFTPAASCPEPNQNLKCFDFNADNNELNRHRITVASNEDSLKSDNNLSVSCQNNLCSTEFIVGQKVEEDDPAADLTDYPVITAVTPDNGASGNWVTVWGEHFGLPIGRVTLSGILANLPAQDICPSSWLDNQIIIELPNGLVVGNHQLQVITAADLASNNFDFLINDIVRPGICNVEPNQAGVGESLTVRGIQFGNDTDQRDIYFGRPDNGVSAASQVWREQPNYQEATGEVPNLQSGLTSVRVSVNNESSNPLNFNVTRGEAAAQLRINYFTPDFGAPNQYVTIYGSGFGSYSRGQSQVKFATDKLGSFAFPDECGTNFWTDTQIVVKVPNPEEVGELATQGPLQVITAAGQTAISKDNFSYQPQAPVTPGICSLYPRAGKVGTKIEVAGEGFNDSQLNFSGIILETKPESNNLFKTAVPQTAQSGPVKVVKKDLESNNVDFNVTGEAGEDGQLPADYYQWQFTTCENCLTPEVVESGSCFDALASPTPLKASQDNFVDSLISATFNTQMKDESFVLGLTVVVESCGSQAQPINCQLVGNTGNFAFGVNGRDFEYFILDLTSNLATGSWYRVTLKNLRSEMENIAMSEPYQWYFKTKENNEQCSITNVSVNPSERLAANNNPVYLGGELWYRANGYNRENCNVCPDNFSWSWRSSAQKQAEIDTTSRVSQSLLKAKGITLKTAQITAQATDLENRQNEGTAVLDIVPPEPKVIFDASCPIRPQSPSPYPSFEQACLNAKISVQFDQIMAAEILDPANIILREAATNLEIPLSFDSGLYYEVAGVYGLRGATFVPMTALRPDVWYEVLLSGNLTSLDGASLAGPRSWQFKTRDNEQACVFDRVLVNPASVVLPFNTSADYAAQTLNGLSCELLIEPPNLSWSWRSQDQLLAEVQPSQTSQTKVTTKDQMGETYIRAKSLGVENSGNNGRLQVTSGAGPLFLSITENLPTGKDVCFNALGKVKFNLGLDPLVVNKANFKILRYSGSCPNGCPVESRLTANGSLTIVNLEPALNNNLWDPNSRYAIQIKGGTTGIRTLSNLLLERGGCPQNMAWDEAKQICGWEFTTSNEACETSAIEIDPLEATINLGATQNWLATALAPDNTPLSTPMDSWRVTNEQVADISFDKKNSRLAVSQGLGKGRTFVEAKAGRIIGGASLQVNEVLTNPEVVSVLPAGENVCRNAQIQLVFDQPLNPETVNNQTAKVEYVAGELGEGCREILAQADQKVLPKNLIGQLFNWLTNNIIDSLIESVQAVDERAKSIYLCPIAGGWAVENGQNQSTIKYQLTEALPAGSTIRVTAKSGESGLKAANGLPLLNDFIHEFSTRADICQLSTVKVIADQTTGSSDWVFTTSFDNPTDNNPDDLSFDTIADGDKKFIALGLSIEGTALQPIPQVYEWQYQWQSLNTAVAELIPNEKLSDEISIVGAQNKNGETVIMASAVFPDWYRKASLTGFGKVKVDLCENRWNPTGDQNPDYKFIDANFNFSLSYCRDAGNEGVADDLPALELPQPIMHNEGVALRDTLLREYLLPVPTTADVIGIRIYSNLAHLSPIDWYQKNIDVKGSPVSTEIDGYQAIQDGRTIYAAAANVVSRLNEEEHVMSRGFNLKSLAKLLPIFDFKQVLKFFWQAALAQAVPSPLDQFKADLALLNSLTSQSVNQGFLPIEVPGLVDQVSTLKQAYQPDILMPLGVDPKTLSSYQTNLNSLEQSLNKYQQILATTSDLKQFSDYLFNNQIQTTDTQNFLNEFNQLNQNLTNGLTVSELDGFESWLDDLTVSQNQILAAADQLPAAFNAQLYRVAEQDYRVVGVESGYTNIYLISYNQDANPKTQEILKRLLERLKFNTNVDNPQINEEIRRDTQRLADLAKITGRLENYRLSNQNRYPALLAGTFLSGRSNSKWPSWQQTLGAELGSSLPTDPINRFNACIACVEPQLNNAGFEDGQSSWLLDRPEDVTVSVEVNTNLFYLKEGGQSLGITADGNAGGIKQFVNLLPSTTYEMSAWVYVVSGRVHLTFDGDDYGNEWISPPDQTGWIELKNRLVTHDGNGDWRNSPNNGLYIRSHEGPATFYVDDVKLNTAGGNCGYDPETCWNPEANGAKGAFACDDESYFYSYQALGPTNYFLAAKMETTASWLPNVDPHLRLSTERVSGCTTELAAGYCGDGRRESPEQCEPGTLVNLCSADHLWYNSLTYGCYNVGEENQCRWYNPLTDPASECQGKTAAQCCGGYCGDRVLNTQAAYRVSVDEQCDASAPGNADGFGNGRNSNDQYSCSSNCRDIGGWCGNSQIEAREICDGTDNPYPNTICNNQCNNVKCRDGFAKPDGSALDEDGCEQKLGAD